ncbi:hypothetical protein WA1_07190 [Scytonema hofmannii PCC 7110]|uniref:Uncharacterized protein n=1 Tax=Scytonema hofmannii PCC 7110 TaxID=128403 RepID=A0A139WT50_9CYAN|nr:hypothetical protein [Scytonema hofmannii]KYC35600.1 hypothetical protein WA1_07190 [Scytonema hofmannii PCC 7110]
MATLSSQLSITVSQKSWSCVLDPSLLLSPYGLWVVKSLGTTIELWVARELWHMLDNTHFYQQQPESIIMQAVLEHSLEIQSTARQEVIEVLQDWESFKRNTNLANLKLFWVGDNPGESFLPPNTDSRLLQHWEFLAHSLDLQINQHSSISNVLASAFRDTISLATALDLAFILTYQRPEDGMECPPVICTALESWGIPCRAINPLDPLATIERENLRHLIVKAGFSKYLWAGLNLAVLYLVVPSAFSIGWRTDPREISSLDRKKCVENTAPNADFWKGSQGFWYQI